VRLEKVILRLDFPYHQYTTSNQQKLLLSALVNSNEFEYAADVFARDILIPPESYAFIKTQFGRRVVPEKDVIEWARELSIAPGIIIGRLQHERVIPQNMYNGLHQRLEWSA